MIRLSFAFSVPEVHSVMTKKPASKLSLYQLIKRHCPGKSNPDSIHRLCTLMRWFDVKNVVTENLEQGSPEFRRWKQESEAIEKRLKVQLAFQVQKITFITGSDTENLETLADSEILGYGIIASVTFPDGFVWSYLFEAIVREIAIRDSTGTWIKHPTHFLHVRRTYKATVGKKEYSIKGSYFRQKNGITNVCAHACAVIMINSIGDNELVTCEDINNMLGIDHMDSMLAIDRAITGYCDVERPPKPPAGLTYPQLMHIFTEFGFTPVPAIYLHGVADEEFRNGELHEEDTFRRFLYGFIESGFPALFTFNANGQKNKDVEHVAAVVGHTLSPHSWLPLARRSIEGVNSYNSSLQWIDDLIIHDEAIGASCTLPSRAFTPGADPEGYQNFNPSTAIGIFPSRYGIRISAIDAEDIAVQFLRERTAGRPTDLMLHNEYTSRLWSAAGGLLKASTVFRTQLVSMSDYLSHLRKFIEMNDFAENIHRDYLEPQADYVWLTEVSEPDLFAGNRAKLMDILIDPKGDPDAPNPILFWRAPNFGVVRLPKSSEKRLYTLWNTDGHLPMYTRD